MKRWRAAAIGLVATFAAACDDGYYFHIENVSGQAVVVRSNGAPERIIYGSSSAQFGYYDLYRPLEFEVGGCLYAIPAPWQDWKAYAERYGVNRPPKTIRIERDLSLVFVLPRTEARSPLAGGPIEQIDSFTLNPEPRGCRAAAEAP